jgi:hypothetical protein
MIESASYVTYAAVAVKAALVLAALVLVVSLIVIDPALCCKDSVKYKSNFVVVGLVTQAPFKGDNGTPGETLPE